MILQKGEDVKVNKKSVGFIPQPYEQVVLSMISESGGLNTSAQ